MLPNTYYEDTICERACLEWFHRFYNDDLNVKDRHNVGQEKVSEDTELEVLPNEDSYQSQRSLQAHL